RQLEAAGIATQVGEREEEAREVNEAFFKFITTGLPFVIVKLALSLDGKLATKTGSSQWITGEESRKRVHQLRAQVDAIAVGINTVLQDDPSLTARDETGGLVKAPLRVVVDGAGRLPSSARLLAQPGRTLVAVGKEHKALAFAGDSVEVVELGEEGDDIDLSLLLRCLGQRGVTSLLVEGGGSLVGSFFDHGLVDKFYAFIAPIIIGGREAKVIAGEGVVEVSQALRLKKVGLEKLGPDVLIWGYL
ncbi:MAG: bifunctional diaminohydroxyphosphoribosylaminopyrimidine deaminase/5-amino-6-(5-phosphoribosylamino)uracil reductase RibD, partial [Chloroflexota bacterium]